MSHDFLTALPPQNLTSIELTDKEQVIIRTILPIISELHDNKDIIIIQGLTQLLVRLRDWNAPLNPLHVKSVTC